MENQKCIYCREYGNLPCEECDKKNKENLTMEKTKFIRVAVDERLPQSSGNYWINDVVGEMKSSYFNSTLKSFPAYDFVEFWIDSVPDRESELIEMLEEIRDGKIRPREYVSEWDILNEFIESVKQPK